MLPYLIMGAGAVGSALGGFLARSGHQITLVARRPHVLAITRQGGLQVTTYDETFKAAMDASETPPESLAPEAVILLTVQAPDVVPALQELGGLARKHPVVTFQNGIRAESDAQPWCPRVYGGIVRFTATMLHPGEVRLRRPGALILGKAPSGTDALAARIAADLRVAGFQAAESPEIQVEKMLKLAVNLVSGPAVLMKRTRAEPALAKVQAALLREASSVFLAAGLRAEPLSGIGKTMTEMIRQFEGGGSAPDGKPVYNSTWQNLYHRRPRLENRYYHGEIGELGQQHSVSTPVNDRVLEVLERVLAEGRGPEPYSPAEFEALFADVVDMSQPLTGDNQDLGGLEI